MELDQIKSIWQQEKIGDTKKDDQLLLLLGKQSNNPIARMRRNVWFELVAIFLLYGIAAVFYFLAFQGRMREASWFMITIAVFFFVYYYFKLRLLAKMECVSCHVRSNLSLQVRSLENYIRFYLVSGTILIPVTLMFFSWLIYYKLSFRPISIFFPGAGYPWWQTALIWLVIVIITSYLSFIMNKWYVNKLYGKHIQKLKTMLMELDEE